MRKSILMLMVVLVAAFSLACSPTNTPPAADAGKDKPAADKPAADKDKGGHVEVDAMNLYKKVGNTWTHKTEVAGNVSFTKNEVTKVEADHSMVKTTMMDKDKKEMMAPSENKIQTKFDAPAPVKDAPVKEARKAEKKKVKVAAGEFDCVSYDGKNWMSEKYPALIVKSEMMELVEWTEGK